MADPLTLLSPTMLASAQFSFSRALATQFGLSRGFDLLRSDSSEHQCHRRRQVPSATIVDIPSNISNGAVPSLSTSLARLGDAVGHV